MVSGWKCRTCSSSRPTPRAGSSVRSVVDRSTARTWLIACAAARPCPTTSPTTRHTAPEGRVNTSYQSPPTCAVAARDVAGGELQPGDLGEPGGQQVAAHHRGRRALGLRHAGLDGHRRPVGHHLQQLGVLLGEAAPGQRAHVQHAQHGACGHQRHAQQRGDALLPQDRVEHVVVIDLLDRDPVPSLRRCARRSPDRAGSARPGGPPPRSRGPPWPSGTGGTDPAATRRRCRPPSARGPSPAARRAVGPRSAGPARCR